jgi:hypothetical protein
VSDQAPLLEEPSMYERMKARGIRMDWYERGKSKQKQKAAIPLDAEACSTSSIYYLKQDGSLWTLDNGEPYKQVRSPSKELSHAMYVCVHCRKQWSSHGNAVAHLSKG